MSENSNSPLKKPKLNNEDIMMIEDIVNSLGSTSDSEIIKKIKNIIDRDGAVKVNEWKNKDKHEHKLIHILVNFHKVEVI